MQPRDVDTLAASRSRLLTTVMATLVLAAAALPVARMGVDLASFAPLIASLVVLGAIGWVAHWNGSAPIARACEMMVLLLGTTLPLIILSYATMRSALPLADATLLRADAALGLSSASIIAWVDRHAWIAVTLGLCYSSFAFQIVAIPIFLVLSGNAATAYRFTVAFIVLTLSASVISAFFPALGTLADGGARIPTLRHIDATYGYFFLDAFRAVRSDAVYLLTAQRAAGILTFPSVHAGVAMICAWAGWQLVGWRWFWCALNAGMLLSAVTHGAHYVVDVIAGATLAVGIIAIVHALSRVRTVMPETWLKPASSGGPQISLTLDR